MWRVFYILLLVGLCYSQNEGIEVNNSETISAPLEVINENGITSSTEKNIPFTNGELNLPAENIQNGPTIPTENKIEEPIAVIPEDISEIPTIPLQPILPENLSAIESESKLEPTSPVPNPEELPAPELKPEEKPAIIPNPIEIPSLPEVILVSGEPVPIAIDNSIAAPGLILAPEIPQKPEGSICPKRNSYFKVDGSCDAYTECREYIWRSMLCPDGMHFNPNATWPEYPCGYPMDVSCTERGVPQEASPTENCPHRYGFYPPLEISPNDCGRYRMCVDGNSIDMTCPSGLAFSPDSNRCDWPENVPSCDAEAFLGFKCPPHPVDARGEPLDLVLNFRYETDCHIFYSCKEGRARLLSCDLGFAFDPIIGKCVNSEFVSCPYDSTKDQRNTYF